MNEYEIMIKNLENRVTELERRTQCGGGSTLTVRKWQPKGGGWWVDAEGEVVEVETSGASKDFGTERQTKEQALRAAVEMRRFNRLLALRDELCGDELVDWESEGGKYFLTFSHRDKKWMVILDKNYEHITPYFISEEMAEHACDLLNDGEVEL